MHSAEMRAGFKWLVVVDTLLQLAYNAGYAAQQLLSLIPRRGSKCVRLSDEGLPLSIVEPLSELRTLLQFCCRGARGKAAAPRQSRHASAIKTWIISPKYILQLVSH